MKFCVFSRQPRSQGSLLPCRNLFGNLSYFEQVFAFWAISLGIFKFCDIGAALTAMWPFFHISQCFSYLAPLLTRQNCTKNAVRFAYFVIRTKKVFVSSSNFWATFLTKSNLSLLSEQLLSNRFYLTKRKTSADGICVPIFWSLKILFLKST